jgi:hypothetical protein
MKPFSLLVAGSRIFLSLSVVVVFSVVLPLVLCLQPHRRRHHFHEHLCCVYCSRVCDVFSALAFWRTSSFALRSWSVMYEGSRVWEIPLSSSYDAPLGQSRWERSSWTSSVVASWAVFRLKHCGCQCWGSEKSAGIPKNKVKEQMHKSNEERR